VSQVKILNITNTETLLCVSAGTASHQDESEECTVCGTCGNMMHSDTAILNLSALIMW